MTRAEVELLDQEIDLALCSAGENLGEVCRYALQGGRRVRASLLLAAAPAQNAAAIQAAAALELLHAATLLQDDIFDAGQVRRGRLAAHLRFGKAQAILASDWLLLTALELAAAANTLYLRSMTRAAKCMVTAEMCELDKRPPRTIDEAKRLGAQIARGKTGALFGAALCGGASLGLPTPDRCADLEELGIEIGITYQFVDDCIDMYGDERHFGKTLGHDAAAGCFTLPLLFALVDLQRQETPLSVSSLGVCSLSADEYRLLQKAAASEAVRHQLHALLRERCRSHRKAFQGFPVNDASIDHWMLDLERRLDTCLGLTSVDPCSYSDGHHASLVSGTGS